MKACYVLDTTVLSNFAPVRQPQLIRLALGDHIYTTAVVMAELSAGVEIGFVPACDWTWLDVLAPNKETQILIEDYRSRASTFAHPFAFSRRGNHPDWRS